MKILWSYLKPQKQLLVGALILAAINQIFSLIDPQIFRIIVDRYASRAGEISPTEFITGVSALILLSVGIVFVSRVAKNFQDYAVNVITQRVGTRLYADSIKHTLSLPFEVFEDQRSGELLQVLAKARTDNERVIVSFINTIYLALIGIVFVIAYALWVHWLIALVYALMIPILGGLTFIITRKIKTAQTTVIREQSALAGSTTETLRNVELVKSLGLEVQEINRLNEVNGVILELELKKLRLVRVLSFVQGTLINAVRSLLLLLLLWLISTQQITLGEFFSLFFYSFFIFNPLNELSAVAATYQEARASNERLAKIMAMPVEEQPAEPKNLTEVQAIAFSDVTFRYGSDDQDALTGLSLAVKPGETVAFVGPSGAGKSTIIKLLVGLYRPTQGTITVNDIDITQFDTDVLRQRIGLVSQETQLFAGTIGENLRFVRPNATDDECVEALRKAAALTIIEKGDQGLETRIGEGGLKLSGGERQRLAIARALLRQPELIIFDEATSSLDSITERSIVETIEDIEKAHPKLITVLVAHRLSTIAHADRIYVLEKGAIVEAGAHQELLDRQGLYAALWREQGAVREV
ncbi:MAG: ABC transporter ATP-binding protein [Candidatus Buchananbacteria bacterium]|nr:ABC transporter ATP-binding protein [Candidatus Buchananbacteria bacterium]